MSTASAGRAETLLGRGERHGADELVSGRAIALWCNRDARARPARDRRRGQAWSRGRSSSSDAEDFRLAAMLCGAIMTTTRSLTGVSAADSVAVFISCSWMAAHDLGLREPALFDRGVYVVAPSVAEHFVTLDGRDKVGGLDQLGEPRGVAPAAPAWRFRATWRTYSPGIMSCSLTCVWITSHSASENLMAWDFLRRALSPNRDAENGVLRERFGGL